MGRYTKKSDPSKRPYRQTRQVNTSINRLTHRAASRISTKVATNKSHHSEAKNNRNEVQNSMSSGSNIGSHLDSRNASKTRHEDFDRLIALADIYYHSMEPLNIARRRRNRLRRLNRLRRCNCRNFVRDNDYFPFARRRFGRTQYSRRVPRRDPVEATAEANLLSSLDMVTSSLRGTLLTLHRTKNLMEKHFDNFDDFLSTHNATNTNVTQRGNIDKFNPNIKVKREIDVIEVKSSKSLLRCKKIKEEKEESEHQQPKKEPKLEDYPEI